MPIILITEMETDPKTGRERLIVSHGINTRTDRVVILPNEPPTTLGATIDPVTGEWTLDDEEPATDRPKPIVRRARP